MDLVTTWSRALKTDTHILAALAALSLAAFSLAACEGGKPRHVPVDPMAVAPPLTTGPLAARPTSTDVISLPGELAAPAKAH